MIEVQVFISYSFEEQYVFTDWSMTQYVMCAASLLPNSHVHKSLKILKNLEILKVKVNQQKLIWNSSIWPISAIIAMENAQHVHCSTSLLCNEQHQQHYYYTCWTNLPNVGFSYMCNPIISWVQHPFKKTIEINLHVFIYFYDTMKRRGVLQLDL
jgi:hypothetical protein